MAKVKTNAGLEAEAEKRPKPEPADGKKPPAKLAVAKDPAWVPLVSGIAIAILVIAPTFWWFGFHKRAESTKPVPMSLTEELKDLKAKLEKAKEDDAARREISATKAELAKFGVVSEEKPPEEEPTASAGPSAQTEEFKRFMEGMTSFTEYMRHVMSRPGGPSAGEPAAAEPVALETEQDTTEETTSEDKASPARPKPSARLVLEVNDGANAYIGGPVVLGPKAVIPADDKVARDLYVLEERLSKKEAELWRMEAKLLELQKELEVAKENIPPFGTAPSRVRNQFREIANGLQTQVDRLIKTIDEFKSVTPTQYDHQHPTNP